MNTSSTPASWMALDLGGEVGAGVGGESLDFFNGDALIGSFRLKGIIEADRVVDVALVEHGDFRGQAVFRNVLSGSGTLGRILEADAEGRIVALDGGVGGSRRGQDQNAVVLGGSNNGGVLTGENAARQTSMPLSISMP